MWTATIRESLLKRWNTEMDDLDVIMNRYGAALCYLFGSQAAAGVKRLHGHGGDATAADPESDVDFAVHFAHPPADALNTYAFLSLDLQDLVAPLRADLLFLHEVDPLIRLEAIRGTCVYAISQEFRLAYEEDVLRCAADALALFRRNEKDFLDALQHGYFTFEYQAPGR